ncbi:MAG: class I SAM-dependent methyltransferase [Luteolibacter sp.]
MSDSSVIARRISSLCCGLWNPHYTKCKLKTDPLYDGVFSEVRESRLPLLDIGCGLGILAMYLRERGWRNSVSGFDYDPRKIESGRRMIARGGYDGILLEQGDARHSLPDHRGDVTILDILQFFDDDEQAGLLRSAASRVAPGGKLIIRSGLREKSARFLTTWLGDLLAKATLWMKAAPVRYPTAAFFQRVLEEQGLEVEIRPFWGRTPFNNYLILARRPGFHTASDVPLSG